MRFNIYLLGLAVVAGFTGCQTPEKKQDKELATLRLHIEVSRDDLGLWETVPVFRSSPVMITVNRQPFLNEGDVAEARVLDDSMGGFSLSIKFEQMGARLLEQYTATNPGRRIAIYSQFGEKGELNRWLAAPVIGRRISDGLISFTPDATRAEAERIANALNNVAIKNGNQEKPKKDKDK